MCVVAYQGVPGAFSHMTAIRAFGPDVTYQGCSTFGEVFELLTQQKVDYAVIPLENSLVGSIEENYELLHSHDVYIIGEHFTKITHCLLAIHSSKDLITKVLSHPKALLQCERFFKAHPHMQPVVHMDTAAAAAEIALTQEGSCAAIASLEASKLYGLEVLQENIEDFPNNYTRFVVISNQPKLDKKADKCSLILQLDHLPGKLAKVLLAFAEQKINLTKIESRARKETLFEYRFYLDFEFSSEEADSVGELLCKLASEVPALNILGFYKKGIV